MTCTRCPDSPTYPMCTRSLDDAVATDAGLHCQGCLHLWRADPTPRATNGLTAASVSALVAHRVDR